jgi:hypothetical protein
MNRLAPRKQYPRIKHVNEELENIKHVDVELENYVRDPKLLVDKTCDGVNRLLAIMERPIAILEEFLDLLEGTLLTQFELGA